MKFENFFSRIRKLDVDVIWDHDRYVKASPGSTLQSSNNGLTIWDDLGRKSGIFWASKQICCKKRISNFFEKRRNLMSRLEISSWNVSESKEHTRNIYPSYLYEWRISKSEKSFMHNLLAFFKLIFKLYSLIKTLLRKNFIFFKIHISTSILQVCSSCGVLIPKHFRTIFLDLDMKFPYFSNKLEIQFFAA